MTAVTQDGGVTKKILSEGTGSKPPKGATVQVNYVGRLEDGTEFDASTGYPFAFTLGEGKVIKGWEHGIKSMKKGEKAILTCRGDYGYGAEGSAPDIPPNATLVFEVELVDFGVNNATSARRNEDLERLKKIREEREAKAKAREDTKSKPAAQSPPPTETKKPAKK